jgi:hypothetical protein
MHMWSIIVAQGKMPKLLSTSVPQQLDGIQFWGAHGQESKKNSMIVPKVCIQPCQLLEIVD